MVVLRRVFCLVAVAAFRLLEEAVYCRVPYREDVVVVHLPAAYPADVVEVHLLASFHLEVAFFHRVSCRVLVKGRHFFFAHQGDLFQIQALGLLEDPFAAMPAE